LLGTQRALEINDRLGEAHTSLAAIKMYLEWNWTEAERGFRRAIELSPRYAMAHQWYGLLLLYKGLFAQAEERLRFALNLDPLYPVIYLNVGDVMFNAGARQEAIEHLERALELFPDFEPVREALGRMYIDVGKHSEALDLIPDIGYSTFSYRALGRQEEALALLDRLETEGSLRQRLRARMGIGDLDGTFELLDAALEERLPWVLLEPNVYSFFDGLHPDPRWDDYLRRLGLEEHR
jgi:Tfp pilus assembly protein PilF